MEEAGLETLQLIPHLATPPFRVSAVSARVIGWDEHWCVLRWRVDGARDLVVPPFAGAGRADGLWQTTCFELFVAHDAVTTHAPTSIPSTQPAHPEPVEGFAQGVGPGPNVARNLRQAQDERGREKAGEGGPYSEFNFSPSERWAAYDFTAWREGMAERVMARAPVITPRRGSDVLIVDVAIRQADLPPLPWRYGASAVLEEAGGVKSYWATAHGRESPDFHHPACLGARLAAPHAA